MAPTSTLPDNPVYAFCPQIRTAQRPAADQNCFPGHPGLRAYCPCGLDPKRCRTALRQTQQSSRTGSRRMDGAGSPGHARERSIQKYQRPLAPLISTLGDPASSRRGTWAPPHQRLVHRLVKLTRLGPVLYRTLTDTELPIHRGRAHPLSPIILSPGAGSEAT